MKNNLDNAWPLVTVITPTYNHIEFLEDALLSVKNQTYPHIEHIVIDGGSEDGTKELLKSYESHYSLKWISEKDNGQSDAINKGIRMAKGELFVWLNADDVFMFKDSVEKIVGAYLKKGKPDVIVGDMAFVDKAGNVIQMFGYLHVRYDHINLSRKHLGQPSVFIKTELLRQYPLREDLEYVMDFELWLRLCKIVPFAHVRSVISGSRMYKGTKSSHADKYEAEKQKVIIEYGYQNPKPQSQLSRMASNIMGIKVRGLMLLIYHTYIMRSVPASKVSLRAFPKNIGYQLFRKMKGNYEEYWPQYVKALLNIFRR